jgi:hypothetical protein
VTREENIYEKEKRDIDVIENAMIALTAYHLLIVIGYAMQAKNEKFDLFVLRGICSDLVLKRLNDKKVFEHVYVFRDEKEIAEPSRKNVIAGSLKSIADGSGLFKSIYGARKDIKSLKDLYLCLWAYQRMKMNTDITPKPKYLLNYKNVFVAYSGGYIQSCIINASKNSKLSFFEDGTGSYVRGDILNVDDEVIKRNEYSEKKYPKLTLIGNIKPLFEWDNVIYFNPVKGRDGVSYFERLTYYLDCASDKDLEKNRLIYFSQPWKKDNNTVSKDFNELEMTVRNIINEHNGLLRLHPRDKEEKTIGRIDPGKGQWELRCGWELTDDHILVGAFSTAQFTPKWLYDKEPFVIFTFDMIFKEQSEYKNKVDEMICEFAKTYRNPDKVVSVDCPEALNTVLERMINHG